MFSSRLPAHLESNALARALARARARGGPLIDLTATNPTEVGIAYEADLFRALSRDDVARYDPQPFGLRPAREAVAADYRRLGLAIEWDRIVLTSSTSEAYSLLFKLLCDPCGHSVLVPAPSYPLFEHLTALDGVAARAYRLDYDARWSVDFDSLDAVWDASTRAVLAVSPNNPTGSVLSPRERGLLTARCAQRGAALIVDEVFADYALDDAAAPAHDEPGAPALTFRLGGLSKSAALPQVKLGWLAVQGPAPLVGAALERLEIICDAYLSVSTPVQVAAPSLIAGGATARAQIQARVRGNYARLRTLAAAYPASQVLAAQAGWSAVLRIPARATEEEFVVGLLEADGVVVHPGFFFDFPREAYLVVSLLPEPDRFRAGMERVLERANA